LRTKSFEPVHKPCAENARTFRLEDGARNVRWKSVFAAWLAAAGMLSCYQIQAHDEARTMAHNVGRYKVRVTSDYEKVQGTCKFVRYLQPDQDPKRIPTDAELPDWVREEAVLLGADTVLLVNRTAEAYICGPGPLNPDGTLRNPEIQPH
jgi:hypothetical protein